MRVLFVLVVVLGGCSGLREYARGAYRRAVEVREETGERPVETLGKNVPAVVGNPGDVSAWVEIGKALSYILGVSGLFGAGYAVKRKLKNVQESVVLPVEKYAEMARDGKS